MTRKWILGAVALTVTLVVALATQLSFSTAPDFVSGAQGRLESYLSYSYGPLHCSSTKDKEQAWTINCAANNGKNNFVYVVHDAQDEPYGFFLTAVNDAARETSGVDLLSYLDIRANG
ncbi:hypothetical protein ACG1VR_13135 [Cedecea davisae]|uniref:hypothetical protein n=1 Tax=Cedecea davisae TaxID=158484 RepID=UPI00376F0CEA